MESTEYDVSLMIDLLKNSTVYDEFRIKCDVNDIECIITRDEFDVMKTSYMAQYEYTAFFPST